MRPFSPIWVPLAFCTLGAAFLSGNEIAFASDSMTEPVVKAAVTAYARSDKILLDEVVDWKELSARVAGVEWATVSKEKRARFGAFLRAEIGQFLLVSAGAKSPPILEALIYETTIDRKTEQHQRVSIFLAQGHTRQKLKLTFILQHRPSGTKIIDLVHKGTLQSEHIRQTYLGPELKKTTLAQALENLMRQKEVKKGITK